MVVIQQQQRCFSRWGKPAFHDLTWPLSISSVCSSSRRWLASETNPALLLLLLLHSNCETVSYRSQFVYRRALYLITCFFYLCALKEIKVTVKVRKRRPDSDDLLCEVWTNCCFSWAKQVFLLSINANVATLKKGHLPWVLQARDNMVPFITKVHIYVRVAFQIYEKAAKVMNTDECS